MNNIEKAIEILNDTEADMKYSTNEINQAHLLAIVALKKRIPKKVELIFSPSGHEIYFCPSCQENISRDNVYCSQCGQKTDWEVEE